MATEEGIDPTLHPKSTAVLKRLEEANGKDLSLQEAETLRKIALDAEDDLNPVTRQPTPDARLAGKIVDELDDSIEALSTNSEARALWARSRRSQMIDQMIHRAKIRAGAHYTQAGMEHALRQEFKTLALNPRRMRGLTAEQKAAIERVAKGGSVENTLRALGKFDPTSSVVSAAGSLGTSALLSSINPAAAALPVAGFVAKRLATRATKRNVDLAREALVGRGLPAPSVQKQAPFYPSVPFTETAGVMPTRAAMSSGLELEPAPMFGAQVLPAAPSRLSADIPPPVRGDINFTPSNLLGDSELQLATQPQKYPGSLDFTPPSLAPQMAGDLRLAGETPATPAKAPKGGLELPYPPMKRTQKEVLADIRRVEAIAKKLTPEQLSDSAYTAAISQELARLHAELAVRAPRAAKP
jgi:hypothetical protein